ncbi:transcriptional regulator GcvA [Pandoraea sputorum]|uniref:LysR family transcriptional regulator n=1 Tax=Pandoraea sputorum TaxID=93222 RepID=A0A5E5B868_9BURK|nr:transcriptional regulator GcvA [Pandoraea sputorum]VVE81377.1 LysR family transcriptional regulator [Pandoraea sputorum]
MTEAIGRLPSLNALRAFEAASRHLNFRLAADELGVTQGAVAQQVRSLEAELGMKLFERHPRALSLTENGRRYASGVRRAFEMLTEATQALRPEPLRLTISVTPTFASKWLIPRLPAFLETHPDIDLRILATDRLSHFQADAVDLAVRYGRPPFGGGLVVEPLFEEAQVAVASPAVIAAAGHPGKTDGSGRPGSLRGHALLHDAHNAWPQFLDLTLPTAQMSEAKNVRFNQTALAIDAAVAGQGLALAHRDFVAADIAAGRLVRLFDTELRTGAGFYIVYPRRTRHAAQIADVHEWLLRETRDTR